jgi:hypothetical protein
MDNRVGSLPARWDTVTPRLERMVCAWPHHGALAAEATSSYHPAGVEEGLRRHQRQVKLGWILPGLGLR